MAIGDIWPRLKKEAMSIHKISSMMKLLEEENVANEGENEEDEEAPVESLQNEIRVSTATIDGIIRELKNLNLIQLENSKYVQQLKQEMAEIRQMASSKHHYSPPASLSPLPVIRGCYWDGGMHRREQCRALQRAVERGNVHYKGSCLYLGQEGASDCHIRVPYPVVSEDGCQNVAEGLGPEGRGNPNSARLPKRRT